MLGLHKQHPAVQIPFSGRYANQSGASVSITLKYSDVQNFYRQVLLPMFPNGLPARIWVVDYSRKQSNEVYRSLDALQEIFRISARRCFKQETEPSFDFLRLISTEDAFIPQLPGPRTLSSTTLIKMDKTAGQPHHLLKRIVDERIPRACPKYKQDQWTTDPKRLFTALRKTEPYKRALRDIVSFVSYQSVMEVLTGDVQESVIVPVATESINVPTPHCRDKAEKSRSRAAGAWTRPAHKKSQSSVPTKKQHKNGVRRPGPMCIIM